MHEPQQPSERWQQLWSLFEELLDATPDERTERLRELSDRDSELGREVEELLAADQAGLSIVDRSPIAGPGANPTPSLEARSVLAGRFEIVGVLGRGGGGEVYEAIDHELGRRVAVKSLHAGGDEDSTVRARFLREIHLAQQVTHRNVCRVFDLVRDGDRSFVTMELLDGESLAHYLARRGPLTSEECKPIVAQIVEALDTCHAAGIVHRDLKPDNIILVEDSGGLRVVVTDFGIATRKPSLAAATKGGLTQTGHAMGTPAYMAPEQLVASDVGPATDVYALGLLLFEMVTGTRPVDGATVYAVARDRLERPAPSAGERNADLAPRWDRVIRRCLERSPGDRFQSPGDVLLALTDRHTPLASPRVVRQRRQWFVAAGAVVLVAGLAWWQLSSRDSSAVKSASREIAPTASQSPNSSLNVLSPRTLAVLPFATVGSSPEVQLLATGLHNDLLNELSRIAGLSVISRTSVQAAATENRSLPELAQTLGAGTLLEGALQSDSNHLRLTLQLVDGSTDTQRWTARYDGDLEARSLFDLQNEVVGQVVDALEAELGIDFEVPESRQRTKSLEAYRSYNMGLVQFERRTEDGLRRARQHFEAAVAGDPDYGLAWAGLAQTLHMLFAYGFGDSATIEECGQAARRAVAADPNLAEANAALGGYYSALRERPKAQAYLDRAMQLKPSYADAFNWRAYGLQLVNGEGDLEYAQRAVELNPVSIEALGNLAMSYLIHGEPLQALAETERMLELSTSFGTTGFYRALALRNLGRLEEARNQLSDLKVAWTGLGTEVTLLLILLEMGDREAATQVLETLDIDTDPFAVGLARLGFGEVDGAFAAFDRVEGLGHWPSLAIHHLYPETWDGVRDDERYRDLVDRAYRSWGEEPPAETQLRESLE